MRIEAVQDQSRVITLLLQDTNGDPLTGVAPSDVDPIYLRKEGGSLNSKSISSSEWSEVDATNAPGWYELTLSASNLDTLGELLVVIPANGNISLAQKGFTVRVVKFHFDSLKDITTRILGLTQENVRITNHNYDSNNNLIGSTLKIYPTKSDTSNQTNPIAEYEMTASYDSKNRLTDYRMVKV
jgi:hypothetical protein